MTATVESHDRVRLFCAFPLPDEAADVIAAWQASLGAVDARFVRRDDLHITLAFLGHRPRGDVERVSAILDKCAARAGRPRFVLHHYRETSRVGMLALEDDTDRLHGRNFAYDLQRELAEAGFPLRERYPWRPHVTVMRFRQPAGLRPEQPNVRSIAPSDAAAYLSVLRPTGSQYEIIHRVSLGGRSRWTVSKLWTPH